MLKPRSCTHQLLPQDLYESCERVLSVMCVVRLVYPEGKIPEEVVSSLSLKRIYVI